MNTLARQRLMYFLQLGGLAAVYFAAAKLGSAFMPSGSNISPAWPASGLGLAVILRYGVRLWPAIVLGALAALIGSGFSPLATAGATLGYTLEVVIIAVLLRRLSFDPGLTRLSDVIALLTATILATLIGIAIGVTNLRFNVMPLTTHLYAWWALAWLGHALSIILITPLLLSLAHQRRKNWTLRRTTEFIVLLAATLAISQFIFAEWFSLAIDRFPRPFLLFPLLVWATLRFGMIGAATASLLAGAVVIHATAGHLAPAFGTSDTLQQSIASLWAFIGVMAGTAQILAATNAEREQAKKASAAAENKFRPLVEQSLVGIYILQHDKIAYANPWLEHATGYPLHELTALPSALDIIAENGREMVAEHIRQRMSGETRSARYTLNLRRKNGASLTVEAYGARAVYNGAPAIIGVMMDVSERRQAELALAKSEALLRSLFDTAAEGIWILDQDNKTILANQSLLDMLGVSEHNLLFKSIDDFIDEDGKQRLHGRFPYTAENNGGQRGELNLLRADGEQRYCMFSSAPLLEENDWMIGSFIMISDITDKKRAEESLQRLNETLEQRIKEAVAANREKDHLLIQQSRQAAMGEMIGNIAHQWRQPLNALGLLLSNLKDAHAFQELDQHYLDAAVTDGQRLIQKMSTTIDDFRNFFRPDKQSIRFNLHTIIRDTLQLVDASLKNHRIAVTLHVDEAATIQGYPNEYSQVLLNILTNAKDAIVDNQVDHGRIEIELTVTENMTVVTVTDNGGGIPSDILEKIFDPYFTTKEKGTGIGLYMSKMIIENNMKGALRADNADQGAVFSIACPIARNPQKAVHE